MNLSVRTGLKIYIGSEVGEYNAPIYATALITNANRQQISFSISIHLHIICNFRISSIMNLHDARTYQFANLTGVKNLPNNINMLISIS
jgi:hypothetical protein